MQSCTRGNGLLSLPHDLILEVFRQVMSGLDRKSKRALYLVSKEVQQFMVPFITKLLVEVPHEVEAAGAVGEINPISAELLPLLAHPCMSLVLFCGHSAGPRQVKEFFEHFQRSDLGKAVLPRVVKLSLCQTAVGYDLGRVLHDVLEGMDELPALVLEECIMEELFFYVNGALPEKLRDLKMWDCLGDLDMFRQRDMESSVGSLLQFTGLTSLDHQYTFRHGNAGTISTPGELLMAIPTCPHLSRVVLPEYGFDTGGVELLLKSCPVLKFLECAELHPVEDLRGHPCVWEELRLKWATTRDLCHLPLRGLQCLRGLTYKEEPFPDWFISGNDTAEQVEGAVGNLLAAAHAFLPGLILPVEFGYDVEAGKVESLFRLRGSVVGLKICAEDPELRNMEDWFCQPVGFLEADCPYGGAQGSAGDIGWR